MSTKTTIALALAAGFIGGTISQRIVPTPVRAQDQPSVPREIRAHKFVLVDDSGVNRGVFGFPVTNRTRGYPGIELMDPKGETTSLTVRPRFALPLGMLPDATCQTCTR